MTHLFRRLCDWVVGPGGWLIGDDPDDPRLAELRQEDAHIPMIVGPIKDKQGRLTYTEGQGDIELAQLEHVYRNSHRPLTYTEGVAGGWHYETGRPWPKHTKPHRIGEDYPE